jgi:hypothetical protein
MWEYSRRLGADELETHAIGGGSSWFAKAFQDKQCVSLFTGLAYKGYLLSYTIILFLLCDQK